MNSSRFAWFALCSGLFFACGGSVENGGTGGSGAQAGSGGAGAQSGSGGMGAVAATGGASTGATGGVGAYGGGGTGAVGAYGGAGGAMGGAGGTGGDLNQKADAVCNAMASLPCNIPDCKPQLSQAISAAQSAGCADVFGAVLDCALAYPMTCDPQGQPQLAPPCDPILQKFQDCASPNQCSPWADSSGACGEDCSYWGVTCKPAGNGLYCNCTTGPSAGKSFQIPVTCNSPNWSNAVSGFCS